MMRKAICCLGLLLGVLHAGPDSLRQVTVPLSELPLLLQQGTDRVWMSETEYHTLQDRVEALEESHPQVLPDLRLPLQVDVHAQLADDVVEIDAQCLVEGVFTGLNRVDLPFEGVYWTEVLLDGKPAELRGTPGGVTQVYFEGQAMRRLDLKGVSGLPLKENRQVMAFRVPEVAGRLILRVQKGTDIEGAVVSGREQTGDEVAYELLPEEGWVRGSFRLDRLYRAEPLEVTVHQLQHSTLSGRFELFRAGAVVFVHHQPVHSLRLRLPADLKVQTLSSAEPLDWESRMEGDFQYVDIQFRGEVLGSVEVLMTGLRERRSEEHWRPLNMEVVGNTQSRSLQILQLEDPWKVNRLDNGKAEMTSPLEFKGFLTESSLGLFKEGRLFGWILPEEGAFPEVWLREQQGDVDAFVNLLLSPKETRLELEGHITLLPLHAGLFGCRFVLPAGWQLDTVDQGNKVLAYDVLDLKDGQREVQVRFPRRTPAGSPIQLHFIAGLTPRGWLEDQGRQAIDFPSFSMPGVSSLTGALAAVPGLYRELKVVELEGLTPLDDSAKQMMNFQAAADVPGFRFEGDTYTLRMEILALHPEVRVQAFSFFSVGVDAINLRYEWIVENRMAPSEQFSFILPTVLPQGLRPVVEHASLRGEVLRELLEDGREKWTLPFTGRVGEDVRVKLEGELRYTIDERFVLPLPEHPGVELQSGFFAVEGVPELEIRLINPPKEVDLGELSDAQYQPGPRLLGTFAYAGTPPVTSLEAVAQVLVEVPETQLRRLVMNSRLSVTGEVQNQALFLLENAPPFLAVVLPEDADSWSVEVDGQAAEPRKGARGEWLIPVSKTASKALRRVQVIYRNTLPAPGAGRSQQFEAPTMTVYAEEGGAQELFPVETIWNVSPPEGFKVVSSSGTAKAIRLQEPSLAVVEGVRRMINLGGGVRSPMQYYAGLFSATRSSYSSKTLESADAQKYGDSFAFAPINMEPESPEEMVEAAVSSVDDFMTIGGEAVSQQRLFGALNEYSGDRQQDAQARVQNSAQIKAEGFRSLQIRLEPLQGGLRFHSLNPVPTLQLAVLRNSSLTLMGLAAGLAFFTGGLCRKVHGKRNRFAYVLFGVLLSTLPGVFPFLGGVTQVFNAVFASAMALSFCYVILGICNWMGRLFSKPLLLLGALLAGWVVHGQTVMMPDPLPIPGDVLVHVVQGEGKEDTLLVPRGHVETLQNRLEQNVNTMEGDDRGLGWLRGNVELQLGEEDLIELTASYHFRIRGKEAQLIRFPLRGAVVGSIHVDGVPALVESKKSGLDIWVEGEGDHHLVLQLRSKVALSQGRRTVNVGVLPVPGLQLAVRAPQVGLQVDVQKTRTESVRVITEKHDQWMSTPLGESGQVNVSWSESLPSSRSGGGLELSSQANLDVFEDRAIFRWQGHWVSKGNPVERIQMTLPADWKILSVKGAALSGWERGETEADSNTLSLNFRREAMRESVDVVLWQERSVKDATISVPSIVVQDALRQTGEIQLRGQKGLELSVTEMTSLRRQEMGRIKQVDVDAFEIRETVGFQAYAFHRPDYQLTLGVKASTSTLTAQWQQVVRVADLEDVTEAICQVDVQGYPVFQLDVDLPEGLVLRRVESLGVESWSQEGNRLRLFSPAGLSGTVAVVMEGRLPQRDGLQLRLPTFHLQRAMSEEGRWLILTDPSVNVSLAEDSELKRIPLRDAQSWVDVVQWPFARLAMTYQGNPQEEWLTLHRLRPEVSVDTFTNLRINHQVIEETILVDARIRRAGLREFSLRIPARFRDANVKAPLLREIRYDEVEDQPDWVDLTLMLQDEVMDQLVVLLERDRSAQETELELQTPEVLTGRTRRVFVAVENAGRDELQIEATKGLERLSHAHAEWATATELLGENVTYAFVGSVGGPQAEVLVTRISREQAVTAGARIGLSQVELQLDESAAYVCRWTTWVDNRTEQLLQASLPVGARLLQVRVAGKEVNPVRRAEALENDLYIPLVKTPRGERDIQVQVVYAGELDSLMSLRSRGFPFPASRNISVELSQVKLYLPESYRWLRFDGTMKQLENQAQLQAGWLAYQAGMAERLTQTLKGGDIFEQARATHSLQNLERELLEADQSSNGSQSGWYEAERSKTKKVLKQAEKEMALSDLNNDALVVSDNRANFRGRFENQSNSFARNQLYWNDAGQEMNADLSNDLKVDASQSVGKREGGAYKNIQSVLQAQQAQLLEVDLDLPQDRSQKLRLRSGRKGQATKYLDSLEKDRSKVHAAQTLSATAELFPTPDMNRTDLYVFSTPRGDMQVTALSISQKWIQGLSRFAVFLLALIGVMLMVKGRNRTQAREPWKYAKVMLVLGLLGFFTGILPVYAVGLIFVGLIGLMRRSDSQRKVRRV
ncbi:hypothetical protein P3T73_03865 [Kiritimatiellota bacterium B12222]|nr:hypothetical protein P3T73_03865 [Kiritimatiellota bacterium B12222]